VGSVISAVGKEVGAPLQLSGFCRFALGEGIEKKQVDFAAEVADAVAR
jgi:elongation factor Ts